MNNNKYTPASAGFRMPGEFEPHDGCWMLWPQRGDVWRNGAKPAQKAFAAVAEAIARSEPVTVAVNDDQYQNARATTGKPPISRWMYADFTVYFESGWVIHTVRTP